MGVFAAKVSFAERLELSRIVAMGCLVALANYRLYQSQSRFQRKTKRLSGTARAGSWKFVETFSVRMRGRCQCQFKPITQFWLNALPRYWLNSREHIWSIDMGFLINCVPSRIGSFPLNSGSYGMVSWYHHLWTVTDPYFFQTTLHLSRKIIYHNHMCVYMLAYVWYPSNYGKPFTDPQSYCFKPFIEP